MGVGLTLCNMVSKIGKQVLKDYSDIPVRMLGS